MKALVTGANGFTGSYMVKNLLKNGYTVRGLVRKSSNLDLIKDLDIELVYADLAIDEITDEIMDSIDVVYHVGAAFRIEGVPKSLPALVKANRIQDKVAGVGFDWEEPQQVFEKVKEELNELQFEVKKGNHDKVESEFGDVLFSMINYARFLKVNPENALERTNKKFIKRFQYLEEKAKNINKDLKDMTLQEMDVFWEEAKKL